MIVYQTKKISLVKQTALLSVFLPGILSACADKKTESEKIPAPAGSTSTRTNVNTSPQVVVPPNNKGQFPQDQKQNAPNSDVKIDNRQPNDFYKESDFAEETQVLDANAVRTFLLEIDLAYIFHNKADDLIDSPDDCREQFDNIVPTVSNKTFEINSKINRCTKDLAGLSAVVSYQTKILETCDKPAFGDLKDQNQGDVRGTILQKKCSTSQFTTVYNQLEKLSTTLRNGQKYQYEKRIAMSQSDGSPCFENTSTSNFTIEDTCKIFASRSLSVGNQDIAYTFKGRFNGVGANYSGKYYNRGSMDFTINGWRGTITFSNSQPTYQATSPQRQTIVGTLNQ